MPRLVWGLKCPLQPGDNKDLVVGGSGFSDSSRERTAHSLAGGNFQEKEQTYSLVEDEDAQKDFGS